MRYALPALTTLVALLLYSVLIFNVGRARGKYKIAAPAVTGNADFERVYRVQMNTLEQLVAFLPALWLFAFFVDPAWASTLGTLWIVGRIIYAMAYYRAAQSRALGFNLTLFAFAALWIGAAWGALSALIHG